MPQRRTVVRLVFTFGIIAGFTASAFAQGRKMGPLAQKAAAKSSGFSQVIINAVDRSSLSEVAAAVQQRGGSLGRQLPIIDGQVAYLPNGAIAAISDHSKVLKISLDRGVIGSIERTGATIGATTVRQNLGVDGTGVGIAIIDSGVTPWHDDLSSANGGQRVNAFVDLVNGRSVAYDDHGHGTHVAGIIAGNGFDSSGGRTGIAPGASLIVVKALDATGGAHISDVIAAFDYVLANKDALGIRVVNVSLSAGVYESYTTDPLTQAAKRLVDAGVVVVAAAGNAGRTASGHALYSGITAPGNAPWVLTVGASSHMGTIDRSDDTMAGFSSRGPTAIDHIAKPDLVAPGVGIESLSDRASAFYTSKAAYLLNGTVSTNYLPYLSLSGTSMSAPVVSGTIALMMQANPELTPNQVKAILQYTSEDYAHYNRLTQGVGFLNAKGAVELSAFLRSGSTMAYPSTDRWSTQLIWGNQLVRGGDLTRDANAWWTNVTWGEAFTPGGQNVQWGVLRGNSNSWETSCADATCSTIQWGPGASRNVVWGNTCGGADCQTAWTIAGGGSAVTTTSDDATGSNDDEVVVWGSSDDEVVVWGSSEDDDVVVWGSDCAGCGGTLWSN